MNNKKHLTLQEKIRTEKAILGSFCGSYNEDVNKAFCSGGFDFMALDVMQIVPKKLEDLSAVNDRGIIFVVSLEEPAVLSELQKYRNDNVLTGIKIDKVPSIAVIDIVNHYKNACDVIFFEAELLSTIKNKIEVDVKSFLREGLFLGIFCQTLNEVEAALAGGAAVICYKTEYFILKETCEQIVKKFKYIKNFKGESSCYVGCPENAPFTQMDAPYKRMLRCLISPELDEKNNDIACGIVEIDPGSQSDWRGHEEGELFYCVQGHGHIRVGGEIFSLEPDTAIYVQPGIPHQTYNDAGNEIMKLLFVLVPPFGGDRSIISKWKSEHNQTKGICDEEE